MTIIEFADHLNYKKPIGRPIKAESDHASRFELLRAWLRQCNDEHVCNKRNNYNQTFPTRVLYVGSSDTTISETERVNLVEAAGRRSNEYVALSHCWGSYTDEIKETYCTSRTNIVKRKAGFLISELPRTFQDAITVTRAMNIPYLWIDSLCIIQYGHNGKDWARESTKMEHVFSQAYCPIAATTAIDSFAGFLDWHPDSECLHVKDVSGQQFYISNDIDDFDHDVGNALLNSRAWVMQEAVLSRRTIHFSRNQIYWECGEGIYCENLTNLTR